MIPSITQQNETDLKPSLPSSGVIRSVQPQFGAAGKASVLQKGDRFLDWAGTNRTREMLVEDFGGFGLLRTMMDSLRGFFFGTGGLNIPAATERLAREGFSILTDNVLAGVSAAGFGKIADKRMGSYSSKWTDFQTLELFQKVISEGVESKAERKTAEQAFIRALAKQLSSLAPSQEVACREILQNYWNNPTQSKAELAAKLTKSLGLKSFDVRLGENTFKLDNLLDDVRLFKEQMERLPQNGSWAETARKTLTSTLKVKNWKLGFVGLGMAATFAVPYAINRATRRFFGIDYYTGEIGLKDQKATPANVQPQAFQMPGAPGTVMTSRVSPFFAQAATPNRFTSAANNPNDASQKPSYVQESLKKGNVWPLLIALLPAPIAAGLFDTVNWRGVKPFSKAWRNTLDFSKSAPFTTQQQMAATFALLIISRLMASRSDNEFRERLVDSGLGWGLWILGTPAIKRAIAGYLDRKAGQSLLLKEVSIAPGQSRKMLRTSAEVDRLADYIDNLTPEVVEKARKQLKWLSRGSLLSSLILLGIVEPFIAIQWTKFNSKKQQNAAPIAS